MNVEIQSNQFRRQLPRNLIAKAISFGSSILMGLWLVPFRGRHIGMAAYGMVPIAALFTQYVGIVTNALRMPVARFMSVASREDQDGAKMIFNTAFWLYATLAIVQVPLFSLGYVNISRIFSIPSEILRDTQILFVCSFLAFVVGFIGSVFTVSTFSNNRLDLDEFVNISRTALRATLYLAAFSFLEPALRWVGYIELVVSLYALVCQIAIWHRITPFLRLQLSKISLGKIRPIIAMSLWGIVDTIGALLFLRVNVWLANRFISAEAGGDYGAIQQWDLLFRNAAGVVAMVISPMVVICYAQKQFDKAHRITVTAVRYLTAAIAVPCGVVVGFSPELIHHWLGAAHVALWPVLAAMVAPLIISCGIAPVFQLQNAYNRVRVPAIATLATGIVNLLGCVIAVRFFGVGILGLALISSVVFTIKNGLFTVWYAARISSLSISTYAIPLAQGLLLASGVVLCSWYVRTTLPVSDLVNLVAAGGAITLAGYTAFAFAFMTRSERDGILSWAASLLHRKLAIGNNA